MLDEHQQLVGVAPLVVVPGNNLYEGVGQVNASVSVEDGGALVAQEVGRYTKICDRLRIFNYIKLEQNFYLF